MADFWEDGRQNKTFKNIALRRFHAWYSELILVHYFVSRYWKLRNLWITDLYLQLFSLGHIAWSRYFKRQNWKWRSKNKAGPLLVQRQVEDIRHTRHYTYMSLLNLGHRMSGLDIANRIVPGIKRNVQTIYSSDFLWRPQKFDKISQLLYLMLTKGQ